MSQENVKYCFIFGGMFVIGLWFGADVGPSALVAGVITAWAHGVDRCKQVIKNHPEEAKSVALGAWGLLRRFTK
ncbi:MAG: hypothetical protein L0Z62_08210 [Gemmataceae bacterium]|nr:hypothetical protein [Gemmataceae bacterium]